MGIDPPTWRLFDHWEDIDSWGTERVTWRLLMTVARKNLEMKSGVSEVETPRSQIRFRPRQQLRNIPLSNSQISVIVPWNETTVADSSQ
jgi:hypothetical protein